MSVERRTILLTGSTGFLGSNLLRRLLQAGCTVVITTRTASDFWRIDDLRPMVTEFNIETNDLSEVFRRHAIDTIVHCATNYGRKEINDLLLLNANLVLPLTLLQLGAEHNVRRFINTDTVLDKRTSSYSLSKHQFKEWLKVYADRMTGINVALEHFYGPFDDESKFVTFIIRSLIKGVERIDLTRGEQKRDFIHIDDVVDAFLRIIANSERLGNGFYHYEIGSARTISIRDFVILAKRLSGNTATKLNFGALPYRPNEVMESRVDITEIQKLGWAPHIPFEEGLEKTVRAELERETS